MRVQDKFEKFQGGPTQPPATRLHVTINPQCVIGLNRHCYERLGRPAAVFLFFNREDKVIAVEPATDPADAAAFPVKRKTHVGWRINASPFFKHYNIRTETTERFVRPVFESDGRLHLDLKETVTTKQFRRKRI